MGFIVKSGKLSGYALAAAVVLLPHPRLHAQDAALTVEHADCTLFGPQRERFIRDGRTHHPLSPATEQVTAMRAYGRGKNALEVARPANADPSTYTNLIDRDVFTALKAAGVAPAPSTTDFEFIRRVSLDLTGRVPAPERVSSFVADGSPD